MRKNLLFAFLITNAFAINAQIIYTFAGNGAIGFSGDGGVANLAMLNTPSGIAVDASGNVYFADYNNNRIRKVNTSGIISTYAGTGVAGFSGDGGAATAAQFNQPYKVAVDASGNVYVADYANYRIRKINTSGIITTIAGTGVSGYSGDGGAATSADLYVPTGVGVDASGNVYIGQSGRVRKVNTSGIISTFAGTGAFGFSGDGGAATAAQVFQVCGFAFDASGNIYIADGSNARIRKISSTGTITTFAGTGNTSFNGDGGSATSANINAAELAVDASGNVFIADDGNNRIRKVSTSGIITTFAGTGVGGFTGDGGIPTSAQLSGPAAIAIDASGNFYISDYTNYRVREICVGACLTNVNSLTSNSNNILIFPNPNSGSFKLQIDTEIENGEIVLINSLGQKVHEQKIFQGQNNIVTNGLATGLYNYIVLQDKQQIDNGKLTVE